MVDQMTVEELAHMLRQGDVDGVNKIRQSGVKCSLKGADLRGVDLRNLEVAGLDMSDCYLRQADLRGMDFSTTNLQGASLHSAKISGALFPTELRAEEIDLSLLHGTRMRYVRIAQ